ncbi:MAG: cbb3-type cytochrome c oxidase subunit II [Candidatus Schekmanbacteria bacterium]|nr:cbb3-type cytochrome c oxidase subunit II [Candidatus Schekmanbacteria bacterium]
MSKLMSRFMIKLMSIYEKPALLTIMAVIVIAVGTIVTMVVPLFMKDMTPHNENNHPYTPLELEGRDIYIREGCNSCHTQTVRPFPDEQTRYGKVSETWEFEYDRPFLWGSKRTGPDLARIGGKYPDKWHYEHMRNPRSIVLASIMPSYAFLEKTPLDTTYTLKKMEVLDYPYTQNELIALEGKTEMDAMVAYLQRIGNTQKPEAGAKAELIIPADAKNPYSADKAAIEKGEHIYMEKCGACHGKDLKGSIGPNLIDAEWLFGGTERDIFISIYDGRPKGMPSWGNKISNDDIWKVAAFIESIPTEEKEEKAAPAFKLPDNTKNPFEGKADAIKTGKEVFLKNCSVCHKEDATGNIGPDLTDEVWEYGNRDNQIFETIYNGVEAEGMPKWGKNISDDDIWKVISFIRSVARKK